MSRDIVGWPNVSTVGKGVWITERLRYNAMPDVRVRERGMIYPIPEKPSDWRENRAVIVSRVRELIPDARLLFYKGGVARFETDISTVEAYTGGYDATFKRKGLVA